MMRHESVQSSSFLYMTPREPVQLHTINIVPTAEPPETFLLFKFWMDPRVADDLRYSSVSSEILSIPEPQRFHSAVS